MRELPSGFFGIAVAVTSVTFRPRWSNPTWEFFELQPTSEPERILASLMSVTQRLGELEPGALTVTDETIQSHNLPVIVETLSGRRAAISCGIVGLLAGALAVAAAVRRRKLRAGPPHLHIPSFDAPSETAGSPGSAVSGFSGGSEPWIRVPEVAVGEFEGEPGQSPGSAQSAFGSGLPQSGF